MKSSCMQFVFLLTMTSLSLVPVAQAMDDVAGNGTNLITSAEAVKCNSLWNRISFCVKESRITTALGNSASIGGSHSGSDNDYLVDDSHTNHEFSGEYISLLSFNVNPINSKEPNALVIDLNFDTVNINLKDVDLGVKMFRTQNQFDSNYDPTLYLGFENRF